MQFKLADEISEVRLLLKVINELKLMEDEHRDMAIKSKVDGEHIKESEHHVSHMLDTLLDINGLKQTSIEDLTKLRKWLEELKNEAPRMHFIFVDYLPTKPKLKLIKWIRREIHPEALLEIQVNHELAGGFILRTGNHMYDYSFRQHFEAAKSKLPEIVRGVS